MDNMIDGNDQSSLVANNNCSWKALLFTKSTTSVNERKFIKADYD